MLRPSSLLSSRGQVYPEDLDMDLAAVYGWIYITYVSAALLSRQASASTHLRGSCSLSGVS
jgi:hypothetical protein